MTERYAHLAPENVRSTVAPLEHASRLSHVDDEDTREDRDCVLQLIDLKSEFGALDRI